MLSSKYFAIFGGENTELRCVIPLCKMSKKNIINHDLFKHKLRIIEIVKSLDINLIDVHSKVFEKKLNPKTMFKCRNSFVFYNSYNRCYYTKEAYSEVAAAIISKN